MRKLSGNEVDNPEKTIRKLLKQAKLEDMEPYHRVVRLINSKFRDCTYYAAQGWRFVVVEKTLVTIERQRYEQN